MRADGGVIRSLYDHILRHLPLDGQRPIVAFRQTDGLAALPPRNTRSYAGPDAEPGVSTGRLWHDVLAVYDKPIVQLEDRGDAVVLRGDPENHDRAVEMGTPCSRAHNAEAARCPTSNDCLVVERIGEAEARAQSAIPSGNQRARAFAPRPLTREPQRPRKIVGVRIRAVGREVAPFVIAFDWGQREFVTDTQVQRQLRRNLPIVLKVH